MSSSPLVRLCGLALVASSVLFVISILGTLAWFRPGVSLDPGSSPVLNNLTSFISVLITPLEMLGLVGLYAHRPQATGIFGLIAFVIAFFGGMLQAGYTWYVRFVEWVLPFELWVDLMLRLDRFPASLGPYALGDTLTFPLYSLGWLLIGVAFLRARLFPRPAVVLLIAVSLAAGIISVVGTLAGFPDVGSKLPYLEIAIGVLQNVALAWLGFALWLGGRDPRGLPAVPAASRTLK
jgi:hypothetical protein